jgi:hypothetical protein
MLQGVARVASYYTVSPESRHITGCRQSRVTLQGVARPTLGQHVQENRLKP